MRRRRLLEVLAGGTAGTLAGCLAHPPGSGSPESGDSQSGTPLAENVGDVELPVPRGEMEHPLPRDHIPAIVDPSFDDDWRNLDRDGVDDTTLPDDAAVIGVEREGIARAYPLRILDWHEIVNDSLGGPIAVTYCVLCGSSVVVERTVAGEPTIFGVSGSLWRDDLVMYDEATESLWSQLLATAIRGERTGEQLSILPSTLTTWGEWQEQYPDTVVLLPPPDSELIGDATRTFDYFEPKYGYGQERQLIGRDSTDGTLGRRTMVIGVESDGEARAYPFFVVQPTDVINDRVGDTPVVVTVAPDDTLAAFDRRIDGETLTFESDGSETIRAGGSRWSRTTGAALDGTYAGESLERANDHPPLFWLGWSNFHPDTDVYGVDE